MDAYVRRFHQRALDYCDLLVEEVLVYVGLYGMLEKYRIFLESLSFPSSSRLMKAAPCTKESVRRISRSTLGSSI